MTLSPIFSSLQEANEHISEMTKKHDYLKNWAQREIDFLQSLEPTNTITACLNYLHDIQRILEN